VPQTLACGRPVIVTRAIGASELVRDGETGFIVDARSVPQLVEALRALAADRRLWAGMCDRCRPSVSDRDYATFAREVRAMYSRVLG
jgi:glycosyltransferase involved in cell wall biosynthesis